MVWELPRLVKVCHGELMNYDNTSTTVVFVLLALAVLAILVLFIAALVSTVRSPHLSPAAKTLWALIILMFPVLGSIVWFALGRNYNRPI